MISTTQRASLPTAAHYETSFKSTRVSVAGRFLVWNFGTLPTAGVTRTRRRAGAATGRGSAGGRTPRASTLRLRGHCAARRRGTALPDQGMEGLNTRDPASYARTVTEVLTVSTATPTREAGMRLAESAITAGLAAGGQVTGPVASAFVHNGEFGQSEEWVVSFKTTAARYAELEAHLVEHHEWKNPEVTAVPLARASAAYVEWVERVTAQKVAHDG